MVGTSKGLACKDALRNSVECSIRTVLPAPFFFKFDLVGQVSIRVTAFHHQF